jgi:hypothetical protein
MNGNVIGQALTAVSYPAYYSARLFKKKSSIIKMQCFSSSITVASFVALGSYDGVSSTIFSLVGNFVGGFVEKRKQLVKIACFIPLFLVMIAMYSADFQGISTIMIGASMFLNVFGIVFLNPQGIRICTMIGSVFYFLFQFLIGNYVGLVLEVGTFLINLVTLIKYKGAYKVEEV